jgi:hypothetical protein
VSILRNKKGGSIFRPSGTILSAATTKIVVWAVCIHKIFVIIVACHTTGPSSLSGLHFNKDQVECTFPSLPYTRYGLLLWHKFLLN